MYLDENYLSLNKGIFTEVVGEPNTKRMANKTEYENTPYTVFVIQSKLIYLNTKENKHFIEHILPRMAAIAEVKGYLFIFTDVQKINDADISTIFSNALSAAFLLDNIAEFASERGQRTVFGNMDTKTLKEDYARCELGDGYFYDIEADHLLKCKFIKYEED